MSQTTRLRRGARPIAAVVALALVTITHGAQAQGELNKHPNADKCAWNFGTTSTLPNGAKYNMTMHGNSYLIQQNWLNSGSGRCALTY
jgi:hypothetical protein